MFGFFLDKDLISGNQSSFKAAGSYINQLLLITHDIYESFADGYEFRGVFLDISKAFDKLWTMILYSNWKIMGYRVSYVIGIRFMTSRPPVLN